MKIYNISIRSLTTNERNILTQLFGGNEVNEVKIIYERSLSLHKQIYIAMKRWPMSLDEKFILIVPNIKNADEVAKRSWPQAKVIMLDKIITLAKDA